MIYIEINQARYEYDIYNLIRSFYPRAAVRFLYPAAVAATVDGGQTADDALEIRAKKIRRAEGHVKRWKERLAAAGSASESSAEPATVRTDIGSHKPHVYQEGEIEGRLASAIKELDRAHELDTQAVGIAAYRDDRILFRWCTDPVEGDRILGVLALAARSDLDPAPVAEGLLHAIPAECHEVSLDADASGLRGINWRSLTKPDQGADSSTGEKKEAVLQAKRDEKNATKKLVYTALCEATGRNLPWGTLSGIRPTKIPLTLLAGGCSDDEIRSYMRDTYLTSEVKIEEAIGIAHTEMGILGKIHANTGIGGIRDGRKGYSLYLNIPFCPSTCLYCSFTSYPAGAYQDLMPDYIAALEREIDFAAGDFQDRRHWVLDTIYIGGGTPTSLSAELLDELLGHIEKKLDLSELKEWTIEAGRPDSITAAKLDAIRRHGVTRISINPQTMKDETLRLIGRHHTTQQIRDAYALARQKDFTDINMDLIVGLPGETPEDVEHTMQEVAKLAPENLTVHSLALKRTARLNLQWEKYENYVMESSDALMELTRRYATEMGLAPYYLYRQKNIAGNQENVGYAKPGCEGIYNVAIMEEQQDIVALGCAADCKRVWPDGRTDRCENVRNVHEYIARVDEMIERKRELFREE